MSLVRTDITSNIREVHSIISEKKILPFAVLLVGAIYAAIAAIFYFE